MSVLWNAMDPPVLSFSPKRIAERITYGFDFVNLISSGESLSSTVWSIVPIRPLNAPLPTQMIFGSANILGSKVFQQIQSGTEEVLYNLTAQVTTSLGNIIEQSALLLTSNNAFEGS